MGKTNYFKKATFLVATLLLALTSQAQRSFETVDGDPTKTRIYTLDNGLKVYMSVNKDRPRISAHIAVNTGHRNDPAETTGLAHYLEHIMFKGTTQYGTSNYTAERPLLDRITALYEDYRKLADPEARRLKYQEIDSISQLAAKYNIPNEYDKLMAAIGGEGSNAYTSFDVTCYTEDIPSNELDNWAKIQSNRFQDMVIRGFHTELEAVYEEKNISLANDMSKLFDALMAKMFPTHSYGTQTTIGTQEHLKNPSIVNIQNYFDRYYRPNNVAICLAGDFDYDEALRIIDRHFGAWKPGADVSPRQFPAQPVFTTPQDTAVVGHDQELIMLGWRFKGAADAQQDTLSLVKNLLYNGTAGLIDLDINQKMTVQQAGADIDGLKDYSVMALSGVPNDGQSLDEVKDILLREIDKLKKGEFSEDMLKAIVNNMKLAQQRRIQATHGVVAMLVDAYINGEEWADVVNANERRAKITKADIVRFANQYFNDGYVAVKKLQGEDPNVKKVEKPHITPIPTNRDMQSDFVKEVSNSHVADIQPSFVDFSKDITKGFTKRGLPYFYRQNNDNDLFQLQYRYEFGDEADNRYGVAAEYLDLLGTKKFTNEEIQQQFYGLACSYDIKVDDQTLTITFNGLNENMEAALKLADHVLLNAKADNDLYQMLVEQYKKYRADLKMDQEACADRALAYAEYGDYNPYTNIMSIADMQQTKPQALLDLLKGLSSLKHSVIYYGPSSAADAMAIVDKCHTVGKKLADVPVNKPYQYIKTTENKVFLAPFEAPNIYLYKYNNSLRQWSPSRAAIQALFNEYYGGGMNTVVFQELREARGLAYSAGAYYSSPKRLIDPEYMEESIISQNDKMMDCINVFREISDEMPFTQAAFDVAKQSLMKSLQSRRQTRQTPIYYYLNAQKLGLDHDLYSDIYRALPSITPADLQSFAKEAMSQKPWYYIILGNESELDTKGLEQIAPLQRISLEQIFGY